MHPIRVLNLFTNMNRGGAESMVMNYYRAIDRSQIQFDFMVHRQERGLFEDEIEALGGRIYRMPAITLRNIQTYKTRLSSFFIEHPEYRIIHGHMSELGYFAYKAAEKHGVPVRISHAHLSPINFDSKTIPRHILKSLGKSHVTHMFSCGQKAGEWLFGRKNLNNLILMRNAVNFQDFAFSVSARRTMRMRMNLADQFVIGHVGRFEYQKNHTFLLDIFSHVVRKKPTAILLLIGDGPLRKEMEIKAETLGLAERVRFLGIRSDISELMQVMDVFVFPSHFEGLPVTVIEAQSAGLHCILSDAITRECDVTSNVDFLPLSAPLQVWADDIIKCSELERLPDTAERIAKAGYDIHSNASWLKSFYLDAHFQRIETMV